MADGGARKPERADDHGGESSRRCARVVGMLSARIVGHQRKGKKLRRRWAGYARLSAVVVCVSKRLCSSDLWARPVAPNNAARLLCGLREAGSKGIDARKLSRGTLP